VTREELLARCKTDWRGRETMYGPATGFVYFIAAGGNPPRAIKIGFTVNDPRRRLASLQTSNHEHLRLMGYVPGTQTMEAEFHDVCSALRIRGEWFESNLYILRLMWDQIETAEFFEAEAAR